MGVISSARRISYGATSRPSVRAALWASTLFLHGLRDSRHQTMIPNRRRPVTASRKSSSRLLAISVAWSDNPVTLPPGCERFATRPLTVGSIATAKTIGMTAVACFNVVTAPPYVTMTSTFCRTNSAAISATRAECPSDQRYSIAMVRPSIQPSWLSRSAKAEVHSPQDRSVRAQETDCRQLARLLRERGERPRERHAAERRYEFPP